jgi:hypothetical protein
MNPIIKVIFLLIFSLSSPFLIAQDYDTWFQGGPQVKLVNAKMTIDSDLVSTSDIDSEIGYQVGLFFRVNVNHIYVQPELLFSTVQTQLVFKDYDGIAGFNPQADFEFNTLELPIEIGYKIGQLRLNGGPSFSFLLSGQRSFLNQLNAVTEEYNKLNLMFHFGIGVDIQRFVFDARYQFGLSKTGESLSNIIGTELIPNQRQWIFSLGYNILR